MWHGEERSFDVDPYRISCIYWKGMGGYVDGLADEAKSKSMMFYSMVLGLGVFLVYVTSWRHIKKARSSHAVCYVSLRCRAWPLYTIKRRARKMCTLDFVILDLNSGCQALSDRIFSHMTSWVRSRCSL